MSSEWTAVDALIGELGAVRNAAYVAHADDVARSAIETAVAEATAAVLEVFSRPVDRLTITHARDAIETAVEVLVGVDAQLVRSLHVRARGIELRERAQALIAQARSQHSGKV